MKKLIIGLALISSFAASAAERCEVQAYASIFLTNGRVYTDAKITDGRSVTRQKSWQDCYKYALKEAKESLETLPLVASGWRVSGGEQNTTGYVYYKWTFDDGIFSDTNGKVTKHTDKFETYPADGDLRYFSDGTLFE